MKNILRSQCISVLLIFSFGIAADIYVSPAGNDANPGTISAPLATLAAARDTADRRKAGNTPVTIYLRGGTYYLAAPLTFGTSNSGTATAPVTWRAYQGETPVISGGIKLNSPTWAVSNGSIMVTTITQNLKVDQLFLNGKRQVLARYPNYDSTKILDGTASDCIGATRVARWANPAEGPGYLRGLHNTEWGGNSYIITGKSGTDITRTWVGDNNRGSSVHSTRRMVENIFEELDAPGEWFYRKATGQLYFYPPAGTTLGTATIELASQDELLRIVGTSISQSVKYLTFNGLTFTHTYRTLFSKPYDSLLKGDWRIARAGAIFLTNAENVSIENCTFDQLGGNAIFVNAYNTKHLIKNNRFTEVGASCVAICGLRSSVRCPGTWVSPPPCTDWTPGPLGPDYPSQITVDNNYMYNFGRFEKQVAGVNLSMTMKDTIRHNTMHRMPRAGINTTDGCWGGHMIEYNWVYDCVRETGDHGPYNSWGRDRNYLSNDTSRTLLDAMYTTVIRNNRFESRVPEFGIDLDDGASNYLQYNNLLIACGLKLQWTRKNTYINNIIINEGNYTICSSTNSKHYATRNIIVSRTPITFCQSQDVKTTTQVASQVRLIDSNNYYCRDSLPFFTTWSNRTSPYPIDGFSWSTWQAAGLDVHSILTDPQFTDSNKTWPNYLPRGDYNPRPGSDPITKLGFKPFPMDSFGVIRQPEVGAYGPSHINHPAYPGSRISTSYRTGMLTVSCPVSYHVTMMTLSGRVVDEYLARGVSHRQIRSLVGSGVILAVIRAGKEKAAFRFVIQ